MVGEPGEEALWLLVLSLPSGLVLSLAGALGQVLDTDTTSNTQHRHNYNTLKYTTLSGVLGRVLDKHFDTQHRHIETKPVND